MKKKYGLLIAVSLLIIIVSVMLWETPKLAENVEGSFLETETWEIIRKRI